MGIETSRIYDSVPKENMPGVKEMTLRYQGILIKNTDHIIRKHFLSF